MGNYKTQTALNQFDANFTTKDSMYYNLSITLASKYPKQLFVYNVTFLKQYEAKSIIIWLSITITISHTCSIAYSFPITSMPPTQYSNNVKAESGSHMLITQNMSRKCVVTFLEYASWDI